MSALKTPMIPAFDSWFGTIPFQSLKRTTRTMVTAKENLLLGALAFRGTCSRGATVILKLTGGSSDRDGAENYKRGKLHRERMNTRGEFQQSERYLIMERRAHATFKRKGSSGHQVNIIGILSF